LTTGSGKVDVGVVGIPFDSAVTFRPGARFGPQEIRAASRLIRPYNMRQDKDAFEGRVVVDAGDIATNPFSI